MDDVAPVTPLCVHCDAKCCRYFALEIDAPTEEADFENLRWYLAHGNTIIYVNDGTWYLHIENTCRYLGPDHRCGIYDKRPTICREHTTDECEFSNNWGYDAKFTTLDELEAYINVFLGEERYPVPAPPPPAHTKKRRSSAS